jgi:hypothetical protein
MWLTIWFAVYEFRISTQKQYRDRMELDFLRQRYGPEKLEKLRRVSRSRRVNARSRRHWRRLYNLKRILLRRVRPRENG